MKTEKMVSFSGVSEKKGWKKRRPGWGKSLGKFQPIAKKLNEIKSYWHFIPAGRNEGMKGICPPTPGLQLHHEIFSDLPDT